LIVGLPSDFDHIYICMLAEGFLRHIHEFQTLIILAHWPKAKYHTGLPLDFDDMCKLAEGFVTCPGYSKVDCCTPA
jgi:hypothetical protein